MLGGIPGSVGGICGDVVLEKGAGVVLEGSAMVLGYLWNGSGVVLEVGGGIPRNRWGSGVIRAVVLA